jgi:hypothetical protein
LASDWMAGHRPAIACAQASQRQGIAAQLRLISFN